MRSCRCFPMAIGGSCLIGANPGFALLTRNRLGRRNAARGDSHRAGRSITQSKGVGKQALSAPQKRAGPGIPQGAGPRMTGCRWRSAFGRSPGTPGGGGGEKPNGRINGQRSRGGRTDGARRWRWRHRCWIAAHPRSGSPRLSGRWYRRPLPSPPRSPSPPGLRPVFLAR